MWYLHHRFIEELLSWSSFKKASRFKHLPTSSCLMCVRSQSFQEWVWCWSLCLHLDHRLCLQLRCLSRSPNKFLFSCRVGSVFAFQSIFFFFFLFVLQISPHKADLAVRGHTCRAQTKWVQTTRSESLQDGSLCLEAEGEKKCSRFTRRVDLSGFLRADTDC